MLEVINPNFVYEPVRVEINSKGKIRARKVNYVQTSLVNQLPYPLKLKPLGQHRYFKIREQWRLTDFLFNPMVIFVFNSLCFIYLSLKLQPPQLIKDTRVNFCSRYLFIFFNQRNTSGPAPQKISEVAKEILEETFNEEVFSSELSQVAKHPPTLQENPNKSIRSKK